MLVQFLDFLLKKHIEPPDKWLVEELILRKLHIWQLELECRQKYLCCYKVWQE